MPKLFPSLDMTTIFIGTHNVFIDKSMFCTIAMAGSLLLTCYIAVFSELLV